MLPRKFSTEIHLVLLKPAYFWVLILCVLLEVQLHWWDWKLLRTAHMEGFKEQMWFRLVSYNCQGKNLKVPVIHKWLVRLWCNTRTMVCLCKAQSIMYQPLASKGHDNIDTAFSWWLGLFESRKRNGRKGAVGSNIQDLEPATPDNWSSQMAGSSEGNGKCEVTKPPCHEKHSIATFDKSLWEDTAQALKHMVCWN